MDNILLALFPVILLMATGYGFRHYGSLPDTFWKQCGYLTYYFLAPALEIKVLANKEFTGLPWLPLIAAIFAILLTVSAGLVIWQRFMRPIQPDTFTSMFQGGVRFNTFIALVLAAQLYGDDGVAAVAIIAAVMILLINVLCLAVFSGYVGDHGLKLRSFLHELATNPLILGCVIGLGLNFSGIGLQPPFESFFDMAGAAALPIGLLTVGACLQLDRLRGNWEVIWTASVCQLALKPVLAVVIAGLFGLEGLIAACILLCFAVPTAPSAYVLALQKGGDTETMAAIITAQTLLSAMSIPLVLHFA